MGLDADADFLAGVAARHPCNQYFAKLASLSPAEFMTFQNILFYGSARARTIRRMVQTILSKVFGVSKSMRSGTYGALKYSASDAHIEVDFAPGTLSGEDGQAGDMDLEEGAKCFVSDFVPNLLAKTKNLTHGSGRHLVVVHGFDGLSRTNALAMRKVLDAPNVLFILTLLMRPRDISRVDESIRSRSVLMRFSRCWDAPAGSNALVDDKIRTEVRAFLGAGAGILKVLPAVRAFALDILRFQIPLATVLRRIVEETIALLPPTYPDTLAAARLLQEAARSEHRAALGAGGSAASGGGSGGASASSGSGSASPGRASHLCVERVIIAAHEFLAEENVRLS